MPALKASPLFNPSLSFTIFFSWTCYYSWWGTAAGLVVRREGEKVPWEFPWEYHQIRASCLCNAPIKHQMAATHRCLLLNHHQWCFSCWGLIHACTGTLLNCRLMMQFHSSSRYTSSEEMSCAFTKRARNPNKWSQSLKSVLGFIKRI